MGWIPGSAVWEVRPAGLRAVLGGLLLTPPPVSDLHATGPPSTPAAREPASPSSPCRVAGTGPWAPSSHRQQGDRAACTAQHRGMRAGRGPWSRVRVGSGGIP